MTRKPVLLGRPPLLRKTNAELLLRLLRESGPCSKADLVRASGLSAPSVTNVVATLISTGLVETVGEGDSTGGRPPDILRFKAEHGCVAGVEITRDALRFLLTDLNGRELSQSESHIEKSKSTPLQICQQIAKHLWKLLRQKGLLQKQLLRVTVGVPAIVNVDEGTVLAFTALREWNRVPLSLLLTRQLKCPVLIDNDTNLAAQGEFYCGAARRESDFVFITIGEGVGAGVFLNGRIYRGSQWSAGEIGYLRVPQISREHPSIHKYGKLETALSASGILKSWRASKQATTGPRALRVSDVWDQAASGNAVARRLLRQRATLLADVILDLALILNPNLILLGGEVGNHPALLRELNALLAGSEFAVSRVALGALGVPAALWGAISISLEPTVLRLLHAHRRG
ncbi:MAG TPA: ROK family protein [Candidatus Sulfotelmatobacter sp.]|nr:ROK family protein [Candidatus Sulfotelmatobacter sp.]